MCPFMATLWKGSRIGIKGWILRQQNRLSNVSHLLLSSAQGASTQGELLYNLCGAGVGLQPFTLSSMCGRDLFSSSVIRSEASE